jgi:hypothetical protein
LIFQGESGFPVGIQVVLADSDPLSERATLSPTGTGMPAIFSLTESSVDRVVNVVK